MIRPLVIANWKMNGSYAANHSLLTNLLPDIAIDPAIQVAICPPFPYLAQVGQRLVGTSVRLGAQNAGREVSGAHTGEVSVRMLRELGCDYVLIGHSERRALYGETDATVADRFAQVSRAGLTPVLCVGETLDQRNRGETGAVIAGQLTAVLDRVGEQGFVDAVIAYEPVWAIGTGETASPAQVQKVHADIRALLARYSHALSVRIPILYGGSVKADNARDLFQKPDVNGGLVGGASLDAAQFIAICDALGQTRWAAHSGIA